ncbi:MAG TPA: SAM-dependent methyltransferase [Methylovirgula sp.]
MTDDATRPGERTIELPPQTDASVYFIGHIRTPWHERGDPPRQGDRHNGPECRLEIDPRWRDALLGIDAYKELQILYWMDRAPRDLVLQTGRGRMEPTGTFALRSPARPNPIASSYVTLIRREDVVLIVRGLDCLDMTPLIDVKPCYNARP